MLAIKIMNELLHEPVWTCIEDAGVETDSLPLVHDDSVVVSLNGKIGKLYDFYYEFGSHGMACWFNEGQENVDKARTPKLFDKLNARLAEISDGPFHRRP